MRIDILTLFPEMFRGPFDASILKRAQERGLVSVHIHNIRDYTRDKHHVTDDYPYGGGAGMVMKPEPFFEAMEAVMAQSEEPAPIILLTPQGRQLTQRVVDELASYPRLVLLCGHYEGVDERVREHLATDEISIGDYVLTGGELPAMVLVDAVVRRIPGVLGSQEATEDDSFTSGLLQYPQYTRPAEYRGWQVPEMLLSGNHAQIAKWRRDQALLRTARRRPDLLRDVALTPAERRLVEQETEKMAGKGSEETIR